MSKLWTDIRYGLFFGFQWVHGGGETTKSSALLASYHPPSSITWIWAFYWHRPRKVFSKPRFSYNRHTKSVFLTLPVGGGFCFARQNRMEAESYDRY